MKSQRRAEAIWIEKRSRWQINVQKDGKRKTFTSTASGRKGKHEAEMKADRWLCSFNDDQKLYDALDMFLADKKKSCRNSTYNVYKSDIEVWIKPCFSQSTRLSRVTPYDWQNIIYQMVQKGRSAGFCRQLKALIINFVNYCSSRRWEIEEPRDGQITIPETAKEKKTKRALTGEQLKKLLELDPDEYSQANLFKFAVLTGLRRGECLGLKWSDIESGSLTVNRIEYYDGESRGKTKNARRTIPLQREADALLEAHRQRYAHMGMTSEYVFADERTGKQLGYTALNYKWYRITKEICAEGLTMHELRHTFISIVQGELPDVLLKQIVGHSAAMDTFGIYGHQTEKDNTRTRDIVSDAFMTYRMTANEKE